MGRYFHSSEGSSPILLEMPHSGHLGLHDPRWVPAIIDSKIRFALPSVRRTIGFGCDAAVPKLSNFHQLSAEFDLSKIHNDLARVYCDTNRGRDEVSGLVLENEDKTKHHHGVIWSRTIPIGVDLTLDPEQLEMLVAHDCERLFESPLTRYEFEVLMTEVYDPYHAAVKELHEKIKDRHGFCIHLAFHTLPPLSVKSVFGGYVCGEKAARGPFDPEKNTLPDVILIHNQFKAADKFLVDKVRSAFSEEGLIVEDGQGPFTGGNTGVTKLYGNPENNVHVIGIEHVTHSIEPRRHLGEPLVIAEKAEALQPVYRRAILNLLS